MGSVRQLRNLVSLTICHLKHLFCKLSKSLYIHAAWKVFEESGIGWLRWQYPLNRCPWVGNYCTRTKTASCQLPNLCTSNKHQPLMLPDQDVWIDGMLHMKRNLVRWQSNLIPWSDLQLYSKIPVRGVISKYIRQAQANKIFNPVPDYILRILLQVMPQFALRFH